MSTCPYMEEWRLLTSSLEGFPLQKPREDLPTRAGRLTPLCGPCWDGRNGIKASFLNAFEKSVYFKGRMEGEESQREEEVFHLLVYSSHAHTSLPGPFWSQKARTPSGFLMEVAGTLYGSHPMLISKTVSRELDEKQRWGLYLSLQDGTQAFLAAA